MKEKIDIEEGVEFIKKMIPNPIRLRCNTCYFPAIKPNRTQQDTWVCPRCGTIQPINKSFDNN